MVFTNNKIKDYEDLAGIHKFIYSETIENYLLRYNSNDDNIVLLKKYFQNLRNEMQRALNIPRIIKEFNKRIGWIDGKKIDDDKTNLPRYEKLIRLRRSYDLLVSMSLSIIHNYYWVDITKNEQSTALVAFLTSSSSSESDEEEEEPSESA